MILKPLDLTKLRVAFSSHNCAMPVMYIRAYKSSKKRAVTTTIKTKAGVFSVDNSWRKIEKNH